MVAFYVMKIKDGTITADNVPERWREKVEAALQKEQGEKMVTVVFNPGDTSASKYGVLRQYDYGQILRIQGLNLPAAVEIHFALQPKGGTSVTRIGTTKDGVTDVLIPDSMLENDDTSNDYSIYAFVYITDATLSLIHI